MKNSKARCNNIKYEHKKKRQVAVELEEITEASKLPEEKAATKWRRKTRNKTSGTT